MPKANKNKTTAIVAIKLSAQYGIMPIKDTVKGLITRINSKQAYPINFKVELHVFSFFAGISSSSFPFLKYFFIIELSCVFNCVSDFTGSSDNFSAIEN